MSFFSENFLVLLVISVVIMEIGILLLRLAAKRGETSAQTYTVRGKLGKRALHLFLGVLLCAVGLAAGAVSFAFFPEIVRITAPAGAVFVLLGAAVIRMARTRAEVCESSVLAVPMIGSAHIGKLSDMRDFRTTKAFSAENLFIGGKGLGQFVFDSTVPSYDRLKRDLLAAAEGTLPETELSPQTETVWRRGLRRERAGITLCVVAALLLMAGLWSWAVDNNDTHFAHIGGRYISVTETRLYGSDIFADGRLAADTEQLAKLTNVTTLWADDEGITDLSGIDALVSLAWVELKNNPITDITPLAGLKELHTLELEGCPVSDISPLYGLDKLYLVTLRDTEVTEEQAAQLRESVPGCNVDI